MSNKPLTQRVKENPVIPILSTVALIAGAWAGIDRMSGDWDRSHTSYDEMIAAIESHSSQPHASAQQQLDKISRESRCSTIDLQISIIEQQIWQMEQAQQASQRLIEKRRELRRLEGRREQLRCAALL